MRPTLARAVLALLCCAGPALACLWDYDTLEMERQRFPDVLEVIAGKVLRHSRAFYEWRVKDRERRLVATPADLALHDDLIVALHKVGRNDDAVAAARRAVALAPRRYETLSNLGTVLLLAGHPADGLPYLKSALEVNPDAHFGREKYQVALVEYLLARGARSRGRVPGTGLLLPLQLSADEIELAGEYTDPHGLRNRFSRAPNMTDFSRALGGDLTEAQLTAAVKGVCGMLVFANGDSPLLLEALGDLLRSWHEGDEGMQRLAARAYLRASLGVDGASRAAYRGLAQGALETQFEVKLEEIEAGLQGELAEGTAWVAGIEADEAAWIASGKDPEAEFAARYYAAPRLGGPAWWRGVVDLIQRTPIYIAVPAGLVVLAVLTWIRSFRRRRRAAAIAGLQEGS